MATVPMEETTTEATSAETVVWPQAATAMVVLLVTAVAAMATMLLEEVGMMAMAVATVALPKATMAMLQLVSLFTLQPFECLRHLTVKKPISVTAAAMLPKPCHPVTVLMAVTNMHKCMYCSLPLAFMISCRHKHVCYLS